MAHAAFESVTVMLPKCYHTKSRFTMRKNDEQGCKRLRGNTVVYLLFRPMLFRYILILNSADPLIFVYLYAEKFSVFVANNRSQCDSVYLRKNPIPFASQKLVQIRLFKEPAIERLSMETYFWRRTLLFWTGGKCQC